MSPDPLVPDEGVETWLMAATNLRMRPNPLVLDEEVEPGGEARGVTRGLSASIRRHVKANVTTFHLAIRFSSCGEPRPMSELTAVAAGVSGHSNCSGRLAVYCNTCRAEPTRLPDDLPLVPLAELDAGAFVTLDEQDQVQTDPAIASEVAWGFFDPAPVRKVERLLARRGNRP